MTKTVIAGALGECVHVAGVSNFLRLAEFAGWRAIFLGPAVSIEFTREIFARFLVTIPDEALQLPSKNPAWTNGELLYLMSVGPRLIHSILRKYMRENPSPNYSSKDYTGPLIQKTKEVLVQERGQNSTRWTIAAEHDTTCELVLELLAMFSDEDFGKTLTISDMHPLLSGEVTIGDLFHYVKNHFATYSKQINHGSSF